MKKHGTDIRNHIRELLQLTERALAYAAKRDVAGAMRCIRRRGRVLAELRTVSAENRPELNNCLQTIIGRDRALATELYGQKEKVAQQRDAHRAMKRLGMRFAGKRLRTPRFVDRKA